MDWETAFEQCPPFGVGRGPYGWETPQMLEALEQNLTALRQGLSGEDAERLERYLESQVQYLRGCCRYYYYRGMLYGTREALEIWNEEYGSIERTEEED